MSEPKRQHAFTLIELILVLVIVSLSLALAAPSLRNWAQGTKLKNTTEEIIAAAGFARSQAIATADVHRLEVDAASGMYHVVRVQNNIATTVPGEFGVDTSIPTGFRLELRAGGKTGSTIEFYPNGRTTVATIRVTSGNGEWMDVGIESPAERFHVLSK